MKDCPLKWSKKSFKENDMFFHEKDSKLSSRIVLETTEKYGLKTLLLLFNIIEIYFLYWSAPPPPSPCDQTDPLPYSCSFTLHTSFKIAWLVGGGKAVKMLKTVYCKSNKSLILYKPVVKYQVTMACIQLWYTSVNLKPNKYNLRVRSTSNRTKDPNIVIT